METNNNKADGRPGIFGPGRTVTAALLAYEERFGMASEAFYQRFEAGELGDRADFIEWASFYDMLQNAKKRLQAVSDEG